MSNSPVSPVAPGKHSKRRSGFPGWRFALLALVLAVVLSGMARATLADVYYIPSNSMAPLFTEGDRVLVSRLATGNISRSDVVVFDGRGSFSPISSGRAWPADAAVAVGHWLGLTGSDTVFVKRVIGTAGDTVACCALDGRITVNGKSIDEAYLYLGDAPSKNAFEAVVPQGRLWLMGDHRSISADSRSLLGAPGGGMVSVDRVIGEPTAIIWPPERAGAVNENSLTAPQPQQDR